MQVMTPPEGMGGSSAGGASASPPNVARSCNVGGLPFAHGSGVPSADSCNDCLCYDGNVICTGLICPPPSTDAGVEGSPDAGPPVVAPPCEVAGQSFADGAEVPSGDDCNTCACSDADQSSPANDQASQVSRPEGRIVRGYAVGLGMPSFVVNGLSVCGTPAPSCPLRWGGHARGLRRARRPRTRRVRGGDAVELSWSGRDAAGRSIGTRRGRVYADRSREKSRPENIGHALPLHRRRLSVAGGRAGARICR